QLTDLTLPSGLTNLSELDLRSNLLTSLTLPPDLTKLNSLFLEGNPLTSLVLSEELAAMNLAALVTALRNQGVSIITFPPTPTEVSIPDPGLNAAVREALQKPSGPLTEQDLLGLEVLNA